MPPTLNPNLIPDLPNLPDPYPLKPITQPVRFTITPPGSKSLTNRALLLATLTPDGPTTIHNPLRANDTEVMVAALRQLLNPEAVQIKADQSGAWRSITINPVDPNHHNLTENSNEPITLNLNNAGTATRFLTAACCTLNLPHPVIIDGNDRMRNRPIRELVTPLRKLGASIEYLANDGYPPLRINPKTKPLAESTTTELTIDETLSSQYISALLMIAPRCPQGLTIKLAGTVRSPSYISMTLALMQHFGAQVNVEGNLEEIAIAPGTYRATDYTVEPDASSATYFLAAAAVAPPASACTIENLGHPSLQGDAAFADILRQMGAGLTFGRDFITIITPNTENQNQNSNTPPLNAIDIDMNHMPDAAMTLAILALFAQGETVIRGLANLRYKETDRLVALQNELAKFGATVEIKDDDKTFVINPPQDYSQLLRNNTPIEIETYDDHRMAMAFAVAGTRIPNVKIKNPQCVQKTYPTFWHDWNNLCTSSQ